MGRAQELGFLGPGPVETQIAHAEAFVAAWDGAVAPARVLDLGSGGGVPGLVLAARWSDSTFVLLDAGLRRARFLAEAVDEIGMGGRVEVLRARAEEAARQPRLRRTFSLVTARSFAAPTITAECAAGFLAVGGALLVSDRPVDEPSTPSRWPSGALAELGLVDEGLASVAPAIRRLRQIAPCPDRYPRRTGIPAKRPLR